MTHRPVPPVLGRGPFPAAAATGLVGPRALSGPGYRRLLRGVYQAADLAVTPAVMIRAARELTGHSAVLVGPSAAYAHGVRLARPTSPVHVAVGDRSGTGQALLIRHRTRIGVRDVVDTEFGPATSPARTAVDLARGIGTADAGLDHRIIWVDALLRATGLTAGQARGAVIQAVGLHGIPTARLVVRAVRDGVDSPRETALRLLLVRSGFPEPEVQCPVVIAEITLHVDLGWRTRRTGVEYDGAVHLEPDQHSLDLRRHNLFRMADWTVLQVDARSLARPGPVLRQLRALLDLPDPTRRTGLSGNQRMTG